VECCELKLVDWPEGNYRCIDKPNPRGEIWVGGENISMGYYNMPEKTLEDYRLVDGIRFFATGDIGEMTPEGNLMIIDRKKDLVKLQGGEYVSLNKVETIVKLMPIVDNCCVIANPSKSYCICLITPNLLKLREVLSSNITDDNNNNIESSKISVQKENLNHLIDLFEKNSKFVDNFSKELLAHCLKQGLERFEIPTKAKFVKETWLPDSGLVTDSFKLKRKEIDAFYFNQIQTIYI
jgi:long-chain acyl-CoA synthetase